MEEAGNKGRGEQLRGGRRGASRDRRRRRMGARRAPGLASPGELLSWKAGATPTGRRPRGGAGGSVPVAGIQRHLWLLGRTRIDEVLQEVGLVGAE